MNAEFVLFDPMYISGRRLHIGKKVYLMRVPSTVPQLQSLYEAFVNKYGHNLSFEQWLGQRGKVSMRLR